MSAQSPFDAPRAGFEVASRLHPRYDGPPTHHGESIMRIDKPENQPVPRTDDFVVTGADWLADVLAGDVSTDRAARQLSGMAALDGREPVVRRA
jgi:hypothetical protein